MVANIADLFEHAADLFPQRLAVACDDREATFGQLEERANRLAHHLAGCGVGQGTHVGVYARNSIISASARSEACRIPKVCSRCSHWQSM